MASKESKTRVMISVPNSLLAKIDAFCEESGTTRSAYFSGLASQDLWTKSSFIEAAKQILQEQAEK